MDIQRLFEAVNALPSSVALRESDLGYAILLSAHVVTLCIFAGLVVMMDFRLAGIGNLKTPISQIQKRLFPWQMVGLVGSTVTGLLLVWAQPLRYYGKVFFWIKVTLLLLAGANALIFHVTTYRSVSEWDNDVVPPFKARLAGYLSLALWAGVVVFGRLTAYPWLTTQY
jgi:hypothetical protein